MSHLSLSFLPSHRPFALSSFWWGSLRFFALATTFAPNERKNDNGSGGWRSWRQATTQRQQHKACMRQMPTIRHRMRPQRMWPAAAVCQHRKIGAISFDCFVHYCHSFFGQSGGFFGCWYALIGLGWESLTWKPIRNAVYSWTNATKVPRTLGNELVACDLINWVSRSRKDRNTLQDHAHYDPNSRIRNPIETLTFTHTLNNLGEFTLRWLGPSKHSKGIVCSDIFIV